MVRIMHGNTSGRGGQHGLWTIKVNGGIASGTWRTGSWDVVENETNLTDNELDTILDQVDFWRGVSNDGETPHESEWDGQKLHPIS